MIKKGLKEIGDFFISLDAVTKTLVLINTLMYIFNLLENKMNAITGLTIEQILNTGGMSGDTPLPMLVTSMFAHYSLSHFLMNMLILMLLSHTIASTYSPMTYITIYLLSGLVGNLVGYTLEPDVVALGASGCIYGMIGLLLVSSLQIKTYPNLNNLFWLIFATSIVFILFTFMSDISNNISHIVGFIFGVFCSLALWVVHLEMKA